MSKASIIAIIQLVAITRSSETVVTAEVFAHEVPVLRAIHGPQAVTVKDADFHAIELPNNAEQEYQRLVTKYGERFIPAILQAYPGGADDIARKLSMERGEDTFVGDSEAVVESRRPARPDAAQANGQQAQGTPDAGTPGASPERLSHAEIKAELTARGIEHKGNAPRDELQALLDAAKAGDKADAGTLGD